MRIKYNLYIYTLYFYIDGKQHNSSRDPSDDDSTRITVPSEFSFMDTLHASESKEA
jgi:hypothetical protein